MTLAQFIGAEKKINILSGDLLIADMLYEFPSKKEELNQALNEILQTHDANRGGKVRLTKEEFERLSELVTGLPNKGIHPGGSSANTLVTLCRLLGEEKRPNIDFLGVIKDGFQGNVIKADLNETGINVIPGSLSDAESALSFVFVEKNGTRTIATYPGNARELITPEMVTDDLVEKADVVFVQGSLWEKFDPEAVNKMIIKCGEHKKELWLALPTHAQFNGGYNLDHYQRMIKEADIIAGNDEELMRVLGREDLNAQLKELRTTLEEPGSRLLKKQKAELEEQINVLSKINLETALQTLQTTLDAKPKDKRAIAFISCGAEGAVVLERGKMPHRVFPTSPKGDVYLLGAGDSSFAGFIAGIMKGMSGLDAAQVAMEVAAAKLLSPGARISDIDTALKNLRDRARVDAKADRKEWRDENPGKEGKSVSFTADPYKHKKNGKQERDGNAKFGPPLAHVITGENSEYKPRASMNHVTAEQTEQDRPKGRS